MSKIGVGVGEDFPVDDGDGNKGVGAQGPQNEADDRAEFEAWKRRRDDERAYREDRQRSHDEWHQRKQEFKDRIKSAARDFHHDARDHHGRDHDGHDHRWHAMRFWPVGVGIALLVLAIPVLIVALFFSLISAAFKAPFVIIAIVAVALLAMMFHHRRGYHHYRFAGHDRHPRYYSDDDIQTPRRSTQPPQPKQAPIITQPPPATGE